MNYDELTVEDAMEWVDADELPTEWNWYEALAEKPAAGSMLHQVMRVLSNCWITCACGQQCRALPRSTSGAPKDSLLLALGHRFVVDVRKADWDTAADTLGQIEARTAQLLAEMTATH